MATLRYSDDPKAYRREWMRRKRQDPDFRKRDAKNARDWQKKNPIRYSWNGARQSARTRGYEWSLSEDQYQSLVLMNCSYCGAGPSPINGVDRIDNAVGYLSGNVTTACSHCNYAKRGMSPSEFIAWARRVVLHHSS